MKNQRYDHYQLYDFVLDDRFIQWTNGAEDHFWDQYLINFPEKKYIIQEAKLILQALQVPESPLSTDKKNSLLTNIYMQVGYSASDLKKKDSILRASWKYAASISSILLIVSLAYYFLAIAPYQYYSTQFEETKSILLPDSSEVIINANSSLRVAKNMQNAEVREVWLEGEAFFKVCKKKHDREGSIFIVHAENMDIQVLGTQFNVKSRDGNSSVILKKGAVKVANTHTSENLLMVPGEEVTLHHKQDKLQKHSHNTTEELAWKENNFIFNNESLETVAQQIEEYYGFEVEFEHDYLKDYIFTATVSRNDFPLLKTLLEEAFQLKISKEDNTLFIHKTNNGPN
ncbi:FecR family protein [Fulvivirga ligni]|uniref:FecR family protein n=1 Tax=Fulvivirga ligni TaxID=2904246 RepID=UPI001F1F6FF9|nr:FecR family protein [Fulvivirga ligni]UII20938.1 FecR domain-containing protein [Fulvivirga ligni]